MNKIYQNFITLCLLVVLASACAALAEPVVTSATMVPQTPTVLSAAGGNTPPAVIVEPTETVETVTDQDNQNGIRSNLMNIQIGGTVLTATLVNNSSVDALLKALSEGPITINMRDYGNMEKVGPLGMDLPRNDQQITTEAGDIILFQGNAFVIYYAPNSWNFTRLGKINDITAEELKGILGEGSVTIILSLQQE